MLWHAGLSHWIEVDTCVQVKLKLKLAEAFYVIQCIFLAKKNKLSGMVDPPPPTFWLLALTLADAEEICRGIVDNDSMNSSVQAAASRGNLIKLPFLHIGVFLKSEVTASFILFTCLSQPKALQRTDPQWSTTRHKSGKIQLESDFCRC